MNRLRSFMNILPFVLAPRPKTPCAPTKTNLGSIYVPSGVSPSRTKKSGRTTKAKRKAQKLARRKNRKKK